MYILINTVKTVSCKTTRLLYALEVALDGFGVVDFDGDWTVTGETVVLTGATDVGFGEVGSSMSLSPYCDVHWLIPSE